MTANFQEIDHANLMFEYLKHVRQPEMPLMAMEFWSGWFDRWSEKHHHVDNAGMCCLFSEWCYVMEATLLIECR
jgi:Glycosyl hydrolases family 35